tara:strand:+ start:193 stop:741 length:549 start_codon:yes stop_codon:yes gene_type:complete
VLRPGHNRAKQWRPALLALLTLGLSAGCSPEVSVSEPSDDFPQMRTYTLEKSALPSAAGPGFHNVALWASTVRNNQRLLSEESVALMFALRAPEHQIEADNPVTLTIDGEAHRVGKPFYDGGMRYGDEIRETVGLDLPFPLFRSLAYADAAFLALGNKTIPLSHHNREGLRSLTEQLQSSPQ